MRTSMMFESLEPRALLAGVTIITHGWMGRITGFVERSAQAITDRLGGPAEVPQYYLTVGYGPGGVEVKDIRHVDGTGTPQSSHSGETILVIDWRQIDTNTD